MKDALRSKLNMIIVACAAFALGLGAAAGLDLTPRSIAAVGRPQPKLQIGAPAALKKSLADASLKDGFSKIVSSIKPSVVTIMVERKTQMAGHPQLPPPFDKFFPSPNGGDQSQLQEVSGSGFIISKDGYVVTNNHVVENAEKVDVMLSDQRRFDNVKVVGTDPTTDVALLKLDADDLTAAPLGFADSTRVGDWVLAIGSPGVGDGSLLLTTVTAGIVSAKGRAIGIVGQQLEKSVRNMAVEDFLQTDAVINPGNSGGPLVNASGEVVGMNTAIASQTGTYEGYGFAVPMELIRSVVDDLIKYGTVHRALIGVSVNGVNAATAEYYGLKQVGGAVISDFNSPDGKESPAKKAGLKIGDVIVSVDGQRIHSVGELQRRIREHEPGDVVTLDVVRRSDKKHEKVKVKLTSAGNAGEIAANSSTSPETQNALGLNVENLTGAIRQQLGVPEKMSGVVIDDVTQYGPAFRAGIQKGFLIQDVNGTTIKNRQDFQEALSKLKPGQVANLVLYDPNQQSHLVESIKIPQK